MSYNTANKSQILLPFPAFPVYSLGKGEQWHNFWRVFGVLALPELVRTFTTTAFTTPLIRVITERVCVVTNEVTIVMSM